MHGLGNDFVLFDALKNPIDLTREKIRLIADRHFGVGCDQLLLLEPAKSDEADVNYRIFNADGGEVEQCGNGARCAAVYLQESGQIDKEQIIAETSNGLIKLICHSDGQVTVDMGIPRFEPGEIPILAKQRAIRYQVTVDGRDQEFVAVSMGNPHAILLVDSVDATPVESLGSIIEPHEFFPERVNVGFMQLIDPAHIKLRVYERGVGETLACGTGACAAVVAGRLLDMLDETVTVDLPGGQLQINWLGEEFPVKMTGPAIRVFEGVIDL